MHFPTSILPTPRELLPPLLPFSRSSFRAQLKLCTTAPQQKASLLSLQKASYAPVGAAGLPSHCPLSLSVLPPAWRMRPEALCGRAPCCVHLSASGGAPVTPGASAAGRKYLAEKRKCRGLLPATPSHLPWTLQRSVPKTQRCQHSRATAPKPPCVSHCRSLLCGPASATWLPGAENEFLTMRGRPSCKSYTGQRRPDRQPRGLVPRSL